MAIALGVIGFAILALAAWLGVYLYRNMHYDQKLMRDVWRAGFEEKQASLPDGSVINYGEGPDNGPALLLIHGQTVAWQDYGKVLSELANSFHVFAVDCFGHGASSHDARLYSCETNGAALAWFIRHTIQKPCYVSGHSSGGLLAAWLAARSPKLVMGVMLEDPPLFRVTPQEIQQDHGAFAWHDAYIVTNRFVRQQTETDFPLYYLKHGYLLSLFGGLGPKLVRSAEAYRQAHPERPIQIAWIPHLWLRQLLYMDQYDPYFGNSFYDGSWMSEIDQAELLRSIHCPAVYLKAHTLYGKDGVLYAANDDQDAAKVERLIPVCERIDLKSGHNIHFEHPQLFIESLRKLVQSKYPARLEE